MLAMTRVNKHDRYQCSHFSKRDFFVEQKINKTRPLFDTRSFHILFFVEFFFNFSFKIYKCVIDKLFSKQVLESVDHVLFVRFS